MIDTHNIVCKAKCSWECFSSYCKKQLCVDCLFPRSQLLTKSCCPSCLMCSAFHVNVNLFLLQQNMDIYRRSKLSEQELEALELREREVSVQMSR